MCAWPVFMNRIDAASLQELDDICKRAKVRPWNAREVKKKGLSGSKEELLRKQLVSICMQWYEDEQLTGAQTAQPQQEEDEGAQDREDLRLG